MSDGFYSLGMILRIVSQQAAGHPRRWWPLYLSQQIANEENQ